MKRTVEVFTAGCGVCNDLVQLVQSVACSSCDVQVLDTQDPQVMDRARSLGVRSVPAVVVDGKLAEYASGGGYDEATLRATGIGQG